MPRYKTETRPGLVALYDIRPGNGAGPFLQPRSPHGANISTTFVIWRQWTLTSPHYSRVQSARTEDGVRVCHCSIVLSAAAGMQAISEPTSPKRGRNSGRRRSLWTV